jgi:integrase
MKRSGASDVYISADDRARGGRFVIYDLSGLIINVHEELTEFSLYLSRDKLLKKQTIINRVYSIARFKRFLQLKVSEAGGIYCGYEDLSDDILRQFRDALQNEAPGRAKRNRRRAFIGTVNASLSAAYDWVQWLQQTGRAPGQTIGPFACSVQVLRNPRKPAEWIKPLLLPRAGSGARSKPMNFVPDDQIKEAALEHLNLSSDSEYVVVRNVLIQRLAERVGLRRDSIASLTIDSFNRKNLDACEHSIDVTPPRQKNDYEDLFEVPLDLAYEICSYIEKLRSPFAAQKRSNAKEVFLSFRNGAPMKPNSITAIFSRTMKAAGGPLGAALHAWRHRFAQDEVDQEMAYRLREGLSTSDADVCAAVSRRMGQKNPESIQPYLDSFYTRKRRQD